MNGIANAKKALSTFPNKDSPELFSLEPPIRLFPSSQSLQTLLRSPKDATRTTNMPKETCKKNQTSATVVTYKPILGMFNNHAWNKKKTSQKVAVVSGTSARDPWTSLLTVNAKQFQVATEEKSILTAIATAFHALTETSQDNTTRTTLTTLIEILKTESPNKLRKPSVMFSLT